MHFHSPSRTPHGVAIGLTVTSLFAILFYALFTHWILLAIEAGGFLMMASLVLVARPCSLQTPPGTQRILPRIRPVLHWLAHQDPVDWVWGISLTDDADV